MNLEILNARLSALGLSKEVRKHAGGLFYIVSTRDGRETILNSAMSWQWVLEWSAETARSFYRTFVVNGAAFYPGTNAEPVFHG